ncbi:hypothetical protein CSC14_0955 [Proteus mirabilis]|nr:hypothetical protein CSC16_0197 [Proteus mirabilis]PVF71626.1 hypothetical protein CSC14_0955 [Proteus mirabilis]
MGISSLLLSIQKLNRPNLMQISPVKKRKANKCPPFLLLS